MASGTLGDSNDDLNWRGSCRWTENCIVYTRKTHKKAKKTCNNNDTASATTSVAEEPISAGPTFSTNQTPARPEVKSATVAATCATGVPAASTSDNTDNLAAPGDHDVQGSLEWTKDVVDSDKRFTEHSPLQEQIVSNGALDKNTESSCQKSRPQEQVENPQHVPSVVAEGYHSHDLVKEGNGVETSELQNLEVSQLSNNNEAQYSGKRSLICDADELPQTSVVSPQDRRELSPLSSGNDLPNGKEVSTAQLPIGDDAHKEGLMPGSSQISQGNGPVNVNGVVKSGAPEISTLQLSTGSEAHNDGEMMGGSPLGGSPQASQDNGPVNVNGVVKPLVISSIDDKIRFNLCKATPKNEIKELKKNLECELDQVSKLVKQLESKELQLASYNTQISNSNLSNSSTYVGAEAANVTGYIHPQPQHARSNVVDRRLLLRVNPEVVGAMGHQETRPMGLARVNSDIGAPRNLEPRLYNRQLSVAVMENNNRGSEFVEKEKRTPKANQYYRNSEFLLGKDRLPPESNKRLKTSNGRKHSGETDHSVGFGFGFDKSRNQVFRNCSSLLQRLMKHKFGWVFNEPVNAKALGLVDYHDIIKHPMDLGTIKTRLSQNRYKSPREFAEDVRLVFHNAMTYNPKGQDVHVMAETLLQIFEERWAIIEAEYHPYWKYQGYQDGGVPTPTSRKTQSHFAPASVPVTAYVPAATQIRHEPMTSSMAVDLKTHRAHVGRTPVPKKPKAKDPNKRDMTYDEKQRLSTNLQGLPTEKLDAIVQIIKKRNTALSQHDDEIEVDIDSVDAETLWELDRFVTNYKKSLSKNKRKAELALQARTSANQNATLTGLPQPAELQIESGTAFEKRTALADGEKRAYNGSRSSSSSSSSSDSGSSSSDSDSDSSSGDGSDAGQSPKT